MPAYITNIKDTIRTNVEINENENLLLNEKIINVNIIIAICKMNSLETFFHYFEAPSFELHFYFNNFFYKRNFSSIKYIQIVYIAILARILLYITIIIINIIICTHCTPQKSEKNSIFTHHLLPLHNIIVCSLKKSGYTIFIFFWSHN